MTAARVLYVQYTNPAAYPPIVHSAGLLADEGAEVRLLGTDVLAQSMPFPPHERVTVNLHRFEGSGWRQKASYARFASSAIASATAWRPTWVYASDPLSCPIALSLKRLLGVPVVYHEHDSPARRIAEGAEGTRFSRLVMSARRSLAGAADMCVLPSVDRAREFAGTTGRSDSLVVWNCPTLAEAASRVDDRPGGGLRIVYHGSIVPARLPRTVIEALALTPIGVSLTIVGYETAGHHGYVNELTALATACGVASRVTFQPAVGRDELMRQCGRHDIGLALFPVDSDDVNERSMVGPSNKPFDYLARALPIVVTESREWRETFIDAGFGRECDPRSAKSIAAAWQWFLDHPDERAAMGERGRQRVLEEWNYDRMFRPVMARLLARSAEMSERAASANSIG